MLGGRPKDKRPSANIEILFYASIDNIGHDLPFSSEYLGAKTRLVGVHTLSNIGRTTNVKIKYVVKIKQVTNQV